MSAIILLIFFVVAGSIFIKLAIQIPKWFKLKYPKVITVVLIPLFFVAPFADDWLGMREFEQLCQDRKFFVSTDADKVIRAKRIHSPDVSLTGHWIPIDFSRTDYVDLDTQKIFYSNEYFHTRGGFLYRAGLGMDGIRSCSRTSEIAQKANITYIKLNIDKLLETEKETK